MSIALTVKLFSRMVFQSHWVYADATAAHRQNLDRKANALPNLGHRHS